MTKDRDINIDLIKSLAIFAAIAIHLNSFGLRGEIFSSTWKFSMIFGSFLRFCVPAFSICSGYLIYCKRIDLNLLLNKYLKKFIGIFILSEISYRIIDNIYSIYFLGKPFIFKDILTSLINGNFKYHLYFLFIIFIIYALNPLVSLIVTKEENGELKYLIIFWILTSILLPFIFKIKIFASHQSMISYYPFNYVYNFVAYAILGSAFKKYKYSFLRIKIWPLILMIFLGILGMIYWNYKSSSLLLETSVISWDGTNPFIFIYTFGLFVLCLKVKIKNFALQNLLALISKNTLGVYLIHVFFVDLLERTNFSFTAFEGPKKFLILFIQIILIYSISLAINLSYKKLNPYDK